MIFTKNKYERRTIKTIREKRKRLLSKQVS